MFFNLCWKNCGKSFVGGHVNFDGKGCLATKININFFVRNEVLNIFHTTIFSKKQYFPIITVKNNFWWVWLFQGMGCWTTKMNITFCMGNGVPNTTLKFFHQKTTYQLNKSQKTSRGGTFSLISVVLLDRLFPKKKSRVHPCVDSHQPREFHENQFKTASRIVTVIIIISWKSRSVIF